jgi:hypothetical protein
MGRPVRNYTFEKPVISVGRDPGADVYVDNPGVSRDHFRLERTENGEYQVVDLGSANGTFVNDQMVNASVVHNNDVVRFGKYTLWIGYEVDRRASSRSDKAAALAEAQGSGHTVVLSRAELGKILEHEKEKEKPAEPAKVVPIAMPIAPQPPPPRAEAPPSTWPSLIAGFILGTLFGAGAIWLLLNR